MKYEFVAPPEDCRRLWDREGRPWVRDYVIDTMGWPGGRWVLEHAEDNPADGSGPRADTPMGFQAALGYHGPFTDQAEPCGWFVSVWHSAELAVDEFTEERRCVKARGHRGPHELAEQFWHQ